MAVSAAAIAVVVIGVLLVVGVLVKMMTANRPPVVDNADTGPAESRTERLHETADRPAGPAAEPMHPDRLGGDHSPPPAGE